MRRFEISPAIIAAMRSRALATSSSQQVGMPLHLEMPRYSDVLTRYHEVEADKGRTSATSPVLDPEQDDDFY